jgi:hypothetical protein
MDDLEEVSTSKLESKYAPPLRSEDNAITSVSYCKPLFDSFDGRRDYVVLQVSSTITAHKRPRNQYERARCIETLVYMHHTEEFNYHRQS